MVDTARSYEDAAGHRGHDDVRPVTVRVRLHNCPRPVAEAITNEIGRRDDDGLRIETEDIGNVVTVVYCIDELSWKELARLSGSGTAVAIITKLELADYAQALSVGASGVVYIDTSSATIVDVIHAASRGEVVLPVYAAHFASRWLERNPECDLTRHESELLESLAKGHSTKQLAQRYAYSERTIRRHIQSVYLKLGATNRGEAIELAGFGTLLS